MPPNETSFDGEAHRFGGEEGDGDPLARPPNLSIERGWPTADDLRVGRFAVARLSGFRVQSVW